MSTKTMEFKTETKQLLDLMIHSLYSHKEIFLRELISNASDAIDKARFESLTDKDMLEADTGFRIKVTADSEAGTLTISDNGIGMTKDEAIRELGTIAHSGTKDFIAAIQKSDARDNPELIGQFGVGFYSAFLVADKVTVLTRKAGSNDKAGLKWESTADGSFTVDDIEKEGKGTDVTLHLKDEEKKYLEEWEVRHVIKKYSDFIEHPVVMDVEREEDSKETEGEKVKVTEEETLNSMKAIWLKDKSGITDTEYNEFYKHIAHDFTDPAKVIHYKAEGTSEFTSLIFIPGKMPMDIFYKDYQAGLTLYVKRVKIIEHCDALVPPYLRFVKGMVDSSDLPLNVSRELLQNNNKVEIIKNSVTKKVLDTFKDMKENDFDSYLELYSEFGRILKEGIHFDYARRETIADLLLFASTKSEEGRPRSLADYVESMKEGQEDIYYITTTSLEEANASPYIEGFKEKDYEVLIMLDDVDDMLMTGFDYKDKKLKSVVKGEVDIDEKGEEEKKESGKKYEGLLGMIKEHLDDNLKEVRLSGRLKDSPCCLVTDEGAMDPNMEKLLRSMGQEVPETPKSLEINPSHPLFEAMTALLEKDKESALLKEYIDLVYDQALLLEGSKPRDPASFVKTVSKIMTGNVS